ncbi:unnamed protein product [Euphydryas editha]|uniref:Uncharacterized protein n=1 Tax=Euphydryas editha TaxID=104508 RepID=A0AAU9VEE8_EUPED|nr:unnamed protein product [Euphydryas editha]
MGCDKVTSRVPRRSSVGTHPRVSAKIHSRWQASVAPVCRCVSRCAICKAGEAPPRSRPALRVSAPRPAPRSPRVALKTRKNLPLVPRRSLSASPFPSIVSATRAQPFAPHTCARTHGSADVATHAHTAHFKHDAKNRIVLIYNRHSYMKNV